MIRLAGKYLAIFILLSLPIIAAGQYRFNIWTTDNGLPQNTVGGLLQSPDGYIWFTTNDGIVRFDGVRFKVFNKANTKSISSNRFLGSIMDESGVLWFQTELGTLIKFDGGVFKEYTTGNGLPVNASNKVFDVFDDGYGSIIFKAVNDEYFRYQKGDFIPVDIPGITANSYAFFRDREGGFWIDEDEELIRNIDGRRISYGRITTHTLVFQDRFGKFWFRDDDDNLVRAAGGEKQIVLNEAGRLGKFFEDRQGNIWIASDNGLIKINSEQVESSGIIPDAFEKFDTDDGLTDEYFLSVIQDKEDIIWAGTRKGGLIQITPQIVKVFSKDDWGTDDENIYPILERKNGDIWIGAWANSIVKYSDNGKFSLITGSEMPEFPHSFYEDSRGRMLVTNYSPAAVLFEDGKFTELQSPPDIGFGTTNVILEDNDKNLWFGKDGGLIRYRDGQAKILTEKDGLPGSNIIDLKLSKNGGFWIGTNGGISYYEDGKFTSFTEKDGLASDYTRSLYEDSAGVLWIGSYDGGLSRFKDGKFSKFTLEDGMFSNNVFCILEDGNGWFWMNSNNGIYRIKKQQLNDFAEGKIDSLNSIAYTKKDGLLSSEGNGGKQPAGIKRSNGELWFPTAQGVAVIDSNHIKINPNPPPVLLEEIFIDRTEIKNYGNEIEMQPGQTNLEIHYTGLSFINSELVKFRYRLEGLDKNWNNVGTRRTAFYNNLPPGEYTFQVLAANRDGVWNEEGAKIKFVVHPYFYQTNWFYALVFLSVVGVILLIYFYRVSNLKKFALARSTFAEKLIESQEAERKRVAAELHDGIGQTLAMINNRAVFISQDIGDLKDREKQFEILTGQTLQAIGEVREISFNLRPYLLERLGLTKALRSLAVKTADANKLDLIEQIDDVDNLFPPKAEMSIYRIVQESLSNVLKHAEADEIIVKVERKQSVLHILVQDNGKGFDVNSPLKKESGSGGFGFISLGERVRMLGGDYRIESEIGKGTKVIVSVGLKNSE